jgi:TfoX/Sxy family transcriptional regulator of competence genes
VAYDEALATRVRGILGGGEGLAEKKMFGGLAFLVNGNMACGVHDDELILRLDPGEGEKALADPHVRMFDMTGRPMKGWLLIGPEAIATDGDLRSWVEKGVEFAGSLPPK